MDNKGDGKVTSISAFAQRSSEKRRRWILRRLENFKKSGNTCIVYLFDKQPRDKAT